MKKKMKNDQDVHAVMVQIQEQLAVLDRKLDSFMTKSLKELAEALAASRPVVRPQVQAPSPAGPAPSGFPPRKPMFAIICHECGKDSELPFKPRNDRPVYCRECFAKIKGRGNPPAVSPAVNVAPTVPVSAPAEKPKEKVAAKAKKKTAKKPSVPKKSVSKKKKK